MKERPTEKKPAIVPERAKQAGEIRASWPWVEPEVWTDRMLTALVEGVKGGKWFSLIDKVYSPATLCIAFHQVKANKGAAGVDNQTSSAYQMSFDPGHIDPGRFDAEIFQNLVVKTNAR